MTSQQLPVSWRNIGIRRHVSYFEKLFIANVFNYLNLMLILLIDHWIQGSWTWYNCLPNVIHLSETCHRGSSWGHFSPCPNPYHPLLTCVKFHEFFRNRTGGLHSNVKYLYFDTRISLYLCLTGSSYKRLMA